MKRSPNPSAIVGIIALILVFFTSIPTFLRVIKRTTSKARRNPHIETSKFYEDEDGIATEETQKGYNAALPKYLALSFSVLGFLASLGIAIYTTVHPTLNLHFENWLSVGTWVRMSSTPIAHIN